MSAVHKSAPAPGREIPYKFLDFFTAEDVARFTGRDAEIRAVLSGFSAGRTYVLYGPSGVGKSSLLHAGVMPGLVTDGYQPVYARVLTSPVGDVIAAVNESLGLQATPETLPKLLAEASKDEPVVLVLDQFEEFFIRFDGDKKPLQRELAVLLGRIAAVKNSAVQIIISLREDYYAGLNDLKPELPDILAYGLRLLPLTAFGARQAIIAPLNLFGVAYDPAVIKLLVDDLAANGFDPVILQILCTEVYKEAAKRDPIMITEKDFAAVGGSAGIFLRYVQNVTVNLVPDEAVLTLSILDALTTERQTKMAVRISDLAPDITTAADSPLYFMALSDQVKSVMDHLASHSIVRPMDKEGEWYELLHDRLVPIIKAALDEHPQFNKFRNAKRFVAEFTKSLVRTDPHRGDLAFRAKAGQLMSVQQLEDLVEPFETILRLTAAETDFALRSHILGQTRQIGKWAAKLDAFGVVTAASIIDRALDADDPRIRAGAAFAVREAARRSDETMQKVLQLALTDSDVTVRRRACEALAHYDDPVDLANIRHALRREHRKNALDLLVEFAAQEKKVHGVPASTAFRVRRRLRQRTFHEQRDPIRAAGQTGAVAGVAAGPAWAAVIGFGALVAMQVLNEPGTTSTSGVFGAAVVGMSMYILVAAAILGTLLGWRAAIRQGKRLALGARLDFTRPLRGVVICVLILLTAFVVWVFTMEGQAAAESELHEAWAAAIVVGAAGVASLVRRLAVMRRVAATMPLGGRLLRLAVPLLPFAVLAAAITYKPDRITAWSKLEVTTVFVMAAVAYWCADYVAHWALLCTGLRQRLVQAVFWPAMMAIAGLAPALILHVMTAGNDPKTGAAKWAALAGAVVATISFVAFTGAVATGLAAARSQAELQPLRDGHRTALRIGVLAVTSLVTVAAAYIYYPARGLLLPARTVPKEGIEIDGSVAGTARSPAYHKFKSDSSEPALFRFERLDDTNVSWIIGPNDSDQNWLPERTLRHTPDARSFTAFVFGEEPFRTAFTPADGPKFSGGSYKVRIVPAVIADRPPRLKLEETAYVRFRLSKTKPNLYATTMTFETDGIADVPEHVIALDFMGAGYGTSRTHWYCVNMLGQEVFAELQRCDSMVWSVGLSDVQTTVESGRASFDFNLFAISLRDHYRTPFDTEKPWGGETPESVDLLVAAYLRPKLPQEFYDEAGQSFQSTSGGMSETQIAKNLALIRRAMTLDPRNDIYRFGYISRLVEYGRILEARKAIESAPAAWRPEAWDVYAHAAFAAKRWTDALDAWRIAEQSGYDFSESERCKSARDSGYREQAQARAEREAQEQAASAAR